MTSGQRYKSKIVMRRKAIEPITAAIIAALGAGAVSGLTDASKTAITDAYINLKELLVTRFGKGSEVVKAVDHLESKPESSGRQESLQEEIIVSGAKQDEELLAQARHVLTLVQPHQAEQGIVIHNNAPVQAQNVAEVQDIEQYFSAPPKAWRSEHQ